MTRKIITALLVLVLLCAILPSSAVAAESKGECGENLRWSFDAAAGVLTITGSGEMRDFAYRDTPWFFVRNEIKTVSLPEGLTSIGAWAFSDCSELTSIVIPESVAVIREVAFFGCSELVKVEIPASVTSIGDLAFFGCWNMTSMTIPEGVTSIGERVFEFCASMKTVSIPKNLTDIDENIFVGCESLEEIAVHPENPGLCSEDGVLFARNQKKLIAAPGGKTGAYRIPEGVTSIGDDAFYACGKLTEVEIPESVTSIGRYAFAECGALERVTIPESVTRADDGTFYGCIALTEVKIPGSLERIADNMFESCHSLTGIEIGDGIKNIGDSAFYDCDALRSVTIPESVKVIDDSAFRDCDDLDFVIILSRDCEIDDSAFLYSTITLLGCADSTAERFAMNKHTPFMAIDPKTGFADLAEDAYYLKPVAWAVEHGVTKGTAPCLFSPDAACTRAQVVTFLWRAKGCPEPAEPAVPFTDVNPDDYYYKAVCSAVEQGVTQGVAADRFAPDSGCTRGQVVTFLWRAAGQPEPESSGNPFIDVKSDAYYYKAVLWAVEQGITKGTSADKFSPDSTCTRGQIVTFLYRDLVE